MSAHGVHVMTNHRGEPVDETYWLDPDTQQPFTAMDADSTAAFIRLHGGQAVAVTAGPGFHTPTEGDNK